MEEEELESSDPCVLEKHTYLPGRGQAEIAEAQKHLGVTTWSLDDLKPSDFLALFEFSLEKKTPIFS